MTSSQKILTFDIEDWFHVFFAEEVISRSDWAHQEYHIEKMVDRILFMCSELNVRSTFFIVGWLMDAAPHIARKIAEHQHEVASHTYWHQQVFKYNYVEFLDDLLVSKLKLEEASATRVIGFRAPGFSILDNMDWAMDAVQEAGYLYDSSLLHAPSQPHILKNGLVELAPNSIKLPGGCYPLNGGFRIQSITALGI